ncbi:hypothetical protein ABZ923_16770 [Streptomyces sp. NPDC046881]|uniref:hypothetical protein n=1 Tax=Streptomyces sp. NPDC046881 TaxID=3155374 RepID=UPI0033DFD437
MIVVAALGVGVALAAPSDDGSRHGRGVTGTEPSSVPSGDASGGGVTGSGSTGGVVTAGTSDGSVDAGTSDGSSTGDGDPSPTARTPALELPTKKEPADALRAFADELDHGGSGEPEPDPS